MLFRSNPGICLAHTIKTPDTAKNTHAANSLLSVFPSFFFSFILCIRPQSFLSKIIADSFVLLNMASTGNKDCERLNESADLNMELAKAGISIKGSSDHG